MIQIMKAAIYCGTYRKYNEGSIDGAWLELSNYDNKKEFYQACTKLHNDEYDPEYMFQDWENIPDSMVRESFVSSEVFQVIKELKSLSEDNVREFYLYCDEKGYEQDIHALRDFLAKKKAKKRKTENIDRFIDELKKVKEDIDYYVNETSSVVDIDGHLVWFEKPRLQTKFCFGYSDIGQGMSYDECNRVCSSFGAKQFKDRNLFGFDKELKEIEQKDLYLIQYFKGTNIYKCDFYKYPDGDVILCTPSMKEQYRNALLAERKKFEKRLNSYIKRYGMSKIRTWTYWADE